MKRLGSSDSMGALISMCANAEESGGGGGGRGYGREFQAMLMEGLEEEEGAVAGAEKKRRLSVEQVKALEKNFEMENKLEPERKVKLATELGLQPRQVAVWFQNRRARWKTKQLERDYGVLKANFDALKHNYDALRLDNESLLQEIRAMKSKLYGEDEESDGVPSSSRKKPKSSASDDATEMIYGGASAAAAAYFPDSKDGSSDSDSSAVLNDGNRSPNFAAIHSCPASPDDRHRLPESSEAIMGDAQKAYQPQFVKIEEHNFFGGDEPCNFFSDEQAPTLQWYCQDQWNLAGAGDDNN